MRARAWVVAGTAAVLLAAGSVAGLAATRPGPTGPASCAVPSPAGQRVDVVLTDMGGMMGGRGRMMLRAVPGTVAAGPVTVVAANHGNRAHELVVLPLADGRSAGSRPLGEDDTVDETGSLGEASRGCGAGAGDGILPGQVGWVTVPLQPGRYELLCNLPGHYAAGMYAELDVT